MPRGGDVSSPTMRPLVVRLCLACLAAPIANVCGLAMAFYAGDCTYPDFSISVVIRKSPGLNAVAAGWTTFAAAFSVFCHIQNEQLLHAADRIQSDELRNWIAARSIASAAVVVFMSVIHLVPLPPMESHPPWPILLLHFSTASCFAIASAAEIEIVSRRIEPLLRTSCPPLLTATDRGVVRPLCLLATPGWLLISALGGVGLVLDIRWLVAAASVLEFVAISLLGCYPLSLLGPLRDLERNLNLSPPLHEGEASTTMNGIANGRRGRSPSRPRGKTSQRVRARAAT